MQNQVRQIFSLRTLWYLAFAAAFCFLIPIMYESMDATDVTEIEFILFGFDALFSVVVGLIAGKLNHSIIFVFLFPIMFALTFGLFFDSYVRYFTFVYLILTLLAYGVTKD